MKFLVITESAGKRRVAEHDSPSVEELHSTLEASGTEKYRVFCEISDLIETLSSRVTLLEQQMLHADTSISRAKGPYSKAIPDKREKKTQPNPKNVRVELVDKHLVPENYDLEVYETRIDFELRFHNISSKSIRAVKGDLVFRDLFEAEVFRISITMNDPIAPGQSATWCGGLPYNQFDSEQSHFAGFKAEDLQIALENERVVT